MRLLFKKAARDFRTNLSAFAACVLVTGLAIALLIGLTSAYMNLGDSAELTYERLAFEHISLNLRNASPSAVERVQNLPQVAGVEGRQNLGVRIELPGGRKVRGEAIGIPTDRALEVNRLYIHRGGPLRSNRGEALLERRFAEANGYEVGDSITIKLNDQEDSRRYLIVGLVSSPEYIWLTPDRLDPRPAARRFGVVFMSHHDVEALARLPGITGLHVRLKNPRDTEAVKHVLEGLFEAERDGPARDRDLQPSHSLLERDRKAFAGVASLFPLTLLGLSALMLFLTLWQLLHTQRKQIGILLCQGLSPAAVIAQYLALAAMAASASSLLGLTVGPLLALWGSAFYVETLGLPFQTQHIQPSSCLLGLVAAFVVSLGSASAALRHLLRAHPITLLRSEFNPQAGLPSIMRFLPLRLSYRNLVPLRNLLRQPWRSLTMVAGVTLSNALLLMTLALFDSQRTTLEFYLTRVHRYDLQVDLNHPVPPSQVPPVHLWPGVNKVEQMLRVVAIVRNGDRFLERGIWGLQESSSLLQLFDAQGNPLQPRPGGGLLLSPIQQRGLNVGPGQVLQVELPNGQNDPPRHSVVVGPTLYEPIQGPPKMEIGELQRLLSRSSHSPREVVNGLLLSVDPAELSTIRQRLYQDKSVREVITLKDLRADINDLLRLAVAYLSLMLFCAGLISLALVHACTTMNLSERKGEVACMLVQGIRGRDLFGLLLREALYLWLLGLILGIPAGFAAGDWLLSHYQPDLVDLRLQLHTSTVVWTAVAGLLVTLLASIRAINQLVEIPLAEATRSPD